GQSDVAVRVEVVPAARRQGVAVVVHERRAAGPHRLAGRTGISVTPRPRPIETIHLDVADRREARQPLGRPLERGTPPPFLPPATNGPVTHGLDPSTGRDASPP